MHRLIRILFAISDFCAYTLLVLGAIRAVMTLLAPFLLPERVMASVSPAVVAVNVVVALTSAFAGWLLTRRRLVGVLLLALTLMPYVAMGWGTPVVAVSFAMLGVFALPHALVLWQSRRARSV